MAKQEVTRSFLWYATAHDLVHRFAHELDALGVPLLPRMMAEHAHRETGIDIHPRAAIGDALFIDHGTGVVIGETTEIGERVRIYQGVTLGAKSFPLDEKGEPIKGTPRHPIVEDDVIIYAGATVLGGDTVIGRGSMVGGNVWLTHSIPPHSALVGTPPSFELRSAPSSKPSSKLKAHQEPPSQSSKPSSP